MRITLVESLITIQGHSHSDSLVMVLLVAAAVALVARLLLHATEHTVALGRLHFSWCMCSLVPNVFLW